MTTPKQILARRRNFFKRCIGSFKPNIYMYQDVLSNEERIIFNDIFLYINKLMIRWDVNSTEVGLYPKNPNCANISCNSEKYFVSLCKNPNTNIKIFLCKNCRIEQNYILIDKNEVLGQFKESNRTREEGFKYGNTV